MTQHTPAHPYRSVLYMPGSNVRALDKARSLGADALILDLEDAVAPGEKTSARDQVCDAVRAGGYGARRLLVRVNAPGTPWFEADIDAAIAARPHAILIPKADGGPMLADLAARMDAAGAPADLRLWAMMETPLAMLNAAQIAASTPRLEGFVIGTNDLAKEMDARPGPDRTPLLAGLSLALMAARAYGLICVDGVFNAFRDEAGLQAECEQGRAMGFDGKSLIHPAQIETANRVFAPGPEDLALAHRQLAAWQAAAAAGQGVAVLDGRIVENLHAETARRLIAKAESIALMHGDGQT